MPGNYVEALLLYNEGLDMTRKVCRADHPSIAITLRNIAQVYERQGTEYVKRECGFYFILLFVILIALVAASQLTLSFLLMYQATAWRHS